jgi:REP element-mobilizing transposase RayT
MNKGGYHMQSLPQRKNIRLKGYDYSKEGYYFITICTKNRLNLFGSIFNGEMYLNDYGKIAENELLNISSHYDKIQIDKFVVMPNHIHMI